MDTRSFSTVIDSNTRKLLPGSKCLYFRLYCSANNCDYLLRHLVAQYVESHKDKGVFEKWFFIRYSDPAWHLRLRFFGSPSALLVHILPHFASRCKSLLKAQRLYRVEIGTYEREIERYGGTRAMAAAESLFEIDSETVLQLLELVPNNEYLTDRWKIAITGVDRLLNDFGFSIAQKMRLMSVLCNSFESEFQTGSAFKESLSKRFRTERQELSKLLDKGSGKNELQTLALDIFSRRSKRNRPVIKKLKGILAQNGNGDRLDDIISSIIHMHLNRMLRSAQRAQELIIYNFLVRLYRSTDARQRISQENPAKAL